MFLTATSQGNIYGGWLQDHYRSILIYLEDYGSLKIFCENKKKMNSISRVNGEVGYIFLGCIAGRGIY